MDPIDAALNLLFGSIVLCLSIDASSSLIIILKENQET